MRLSTSPATLRSFAMDNPLIRYFKSRPNSVATKLARAALHSASRIRKKSSYVESEVSLDSLLCGGEDLLSAAQYARHTGDLLRPSRSLAQSPHVQFLEQYAVMGAGVFEPATFQKTAYFRNGVQCINTIGRYFTCTREEQIEGIARRFVEQFATNVSQNDACDSAFSRPTSLPVVRPIQYSRHCEIVDGNHRLAIAYTRGEKRCRVRILPHPVITPLQQLLFDHAWTRGRRELYQPIESPELQEGWVLVRRCADRMELYRTFLEEQKIMLPDVPTYLDVGCSFGWFVRAFQDIRFDAYGVEMDWAGCEIARLIHGLGSDKVTRSEAIQFLQREKRVFDVTSCFSVLHHFVLGRGSISAEEFLQLLDARTGRVMFFDMGQSHEEWFREGLAGWDADHIEEWLKSHTSFRQIYRLGTDRDNVRPYERNYGRTQFALVK